LLRFRIWARIRPVRKRIPGGEWGSYYKITLSGARNIERFGELISFISERKRRALSECFQGEGNTNVDLVYGTGQRLRHERERLGLLQRDVSLRAGCTRTMISAVEVGVRHPSRSLFTRICQALEINDPAFVGLANVHWSPLSSI